MKFNYRIFSVLLAILFFVLINKGFSQNTISGTVFYSDNNQIVTSGVVKAFDLNGVFVAETNINSNGTYALTGLAGINYDVFGLPNGDPEADNFVPTGFPSAIDPSQMLSILGTGTVTNKDIYVQRIVHPLGPVSGFISGKVTSENSTSKDAIVYALKGETVFGYAAVDTKGNYRIND